MNRAGIARGKQQRGIETQAALLDAAGRVFAKMEYDKAKLKDISDEAGISLGSLYFHFGNKDDVAAAVLETQQARMTAVLEEVRAATVESEVDRLLMLLDRISELMARDTLVQGGIRLVNSLPEELQNTGFGAYAVWQSITEDMLRDGVREGSVTTEMSVELLAELVNEVYVGAQHLSGMFDQWASLPERIERARPQLREMIAAKGESRRRAAAASA